MMLSQENTDLQTVYVAVVSNQAIITRIQGAAELQFRWNSYKTACTCIESDNFLVSHGTKEVSFGEKFYFTFHSNNLCFTERIMLSSGDRSPCATVTSTQESYIGHPQCNHTPPKQRHLNHYLYDNLSRVLCELYFQCEHDSNAMQTSKVLSMLSDASLRFAQLHRKVTVLTNATPKNTRSIAWNVSSFSPPVSAAQIASRKNILDLMTSPDTDLGVEVDPEVKIEAANQSESKTKQPVEFTLTVPTTNATKSKKAKKQKKIIRCWADYDSDTDMDLTSTAAGSEFTDRDRLERLDEPIGTPQRPIPLPTIPSNNGMVFEADTNRALPVDTVPADNVMDSSTSSPSMEKMEDHPVVEPLVSSGEEKRIYPEFPQIDVGKVGVTVDEEVDEKVEETKEGEKSYDTHDTHDIKMDGDNKKDAMNLPLDSSLVTNQETMFNQENVVPNQMRTNRTKPTKIGSGTQDGLVCKKKKGPSKPPMKNQCSRSSAFVIDNGISNGLSNGLSLPKMSKKESSNETIEDQQEYKTDNMSHMPLTEIHREINHEINHQIMPSNKQIVKCNQAAICNQEEEPKIENKSERKSWNQMVGSKALTNAKALCVENHRAADGNHGGNSGKSGNRKIEKIIHRLSSTTKHYKKMANPNEQKQRTQLKQQKAERRRAQLREQYHRKRQSALANKQQKREQMRQESERKLQAQKQELNAKLKSAKLRYEKKMKEKARKAKEYDEKIKIAAKEKDVEMAKKREQQRVAQEERMKNASKRYEHEILTKKQVANEQNTKVIVKQQQQTKKVEEIVGEKKEKIYQKLEESQQRRDEILKQLMVKTKENEMRKQDVLQRKKQIDRKKRNVAMKRKHHKNKKGRRRNGNNNGGRTPRPPSKTESTPSLSASMSMSMSTCDMISTAFSDVTFNSSASMFEIKPINVTAMKETLHVLMLSSAEYIKGIKQKKEWIGNCPYSELKAAVQALSGRKTRIRFGSSTGSKTVDHSSDNDANLEDVLVSMLCLPATEESDRPLSPSVASPGVTNFGLAMEETKGHCLMSPRPVDSIENKWLESQLGTILKLMDCREVEDASFTYLLMHLVDDIVELTPCFKQLSLRSQRLLLQCIVNATQKNPGVAHYVIRSKCCLFLLHLLMGILSRKRATFALQQCSEINTIVHTLTISINSIRDFPDLIARKIYFFKHLSVLRFFDQMVASFSMVVANLMVNKNYVLLLRIVPFIQAVTSFNERQCSLLNTDFADSCNEIFDVIKSSKIYGLQTLISGLIGSHRQFSWKKKQPVSVLRIVLHSLQCMNNIARMNLKHFQQMIDSMQMELYHALSYLLQHLTFYFPAKMSNTDKTTDIYNNRYFVARVLLDNVILFIGYCSFRNNKFQQCMRWGDDHNNLIRKLTQLPFDYFSKWQQKKILIPTLISITFENEKNREMLETELSTKHLVQFILRYHHTAFNRNHSQRNRNCVANVKKDGAESTFWNHAYDLEHRFPIELWPVAIQYYRNASRTENDTQ